MLIDEILSKAPTLKRLLEEKIAVELATKQEEIEQLKAELAAAQVAVAELAVSKENDITALQLAIAELAVAISGGEK